MLRVGLLGCGRQGRRRSMAVEANGDKLVAIADTNMSIASSLAKEIGCTAEADWRRVVTRGDLDAVIVCTPNYLHAPMSIAAMNNGNHILCEKPLATTVEDAQEIVEVGRKNGVKVKCGFTLRHHPGILQVRRWFDEGLLGQLICVRIRYGTGGREGYDKEWRAIRKFSGGGQLMDQGVHALDLSRWFLGSISSVYGFVSKSFWRNADVEDNAFCLLQNASSQVANIHVSWTQWKNLFSFEVYGQEAYGQVEGLGGSYGTERATLGKRDFSRPFAEETIEFRMRSEEPWIAEWREFVSSIRDKREPLGNGYDGLQAVKLAHTVYGSAISKRAVEVEV